MKHNKMLCLLLAAVLRWLQRCRWAPGRLRNLRRNHPPPQQKREQKQQRYLGQNCQRNPRRRQRRLSQRKRQNRRNLPPGKHCLQVFRLIRMLPWRKMRSVPKRL